MVRSKHRDLDRYEHDSAGRLEAHRRSRKDDEGRKSRRDKEEKKERREGRQEAEIHGSREVMRVDRKERKSGEEQAQGAIVVSTSGPHGRRSEQNQSSGRLLLEGIITAPCHPTDTNICVARSVKTR